MDIREKLTEILKEFEESSETPTDAFVDDILEAVESYTGKKVVAESSIVTRFVHPPIPSREYDWEANREDYDIGDLVGYGPTREAAIEHLLEMEGK